MSWPPDKREHEKVAVAEESMFLASPRVGDRRCSPPLHPALLAIGPGTTESHCDLGG